ncbi:PucR family transcriptional regulator [Sporomusa termitida]|uniref:Purine catabolism regulatory protein n=1 Tax=Sporomusa termitida TaxID=2377 RepID=A0A517DQB8_9FIRM|nr:PucR family transcriptional regulator ligand-binding domain-containing protein [Sporomusa termitida]QDR79554.1 Purine catabolism regulatory protein [Sporomusa termitida]
MQPNGITVRECLALKAFKRFEVLTGEVGLDNLLNRAGVLESPDAIYWAKEKSFILTMGYVFKDNVSKLVELLPEMAQCGIAALAIKVDRFIFLLTPEVVEKAQEVGIPILKAPSDMTHHEAFQAFYEELFNRQYASRLREAQAAYFGRSVATLCVMPFLDGLAKQIDLPVVLLDAAERVVAASLRNPKLKLTAGNSFDKYRHYFTLDKAFAYPLQAGQQRVGCLIVLSREAVLPPVVNIIVSASLALFTLQMMFDIRKKGFTERELILALLKNEACDEKTVVRELAQYNLDAQQKYLCVVMVAEEDKTMELPGDRAELPAGELFQYAARLIQEECPGAKWVAEDAELIALLPAEHYSAVQKKVKVLGQRIAAKSKTVFPGWRLSFGIASAAIPLMQSHQGYREAGKAAKIGLRVNAEPVVCFENLMSYAILSELKEMDQVKQLYQRFIGQIIDYDRQHHANLLATLEAYCQHNFRIKPTAVAMNIHYNSLQYRLKKIEAITGLRLDTSSGIFELIMGLRMKQLWG